jgi:hypothetical protein
VIKFVTNMNGKTKTVTLSDIFNNQLMKRILSLEPSEPEPHRVTAPAPQK